MGMNTKQQFLIPKLETNQKPKSEILLVFFSFPLIQNMGDGGGVRYERETNLMVVIRL